MSPSSGRAPAPSLVLNASSIAGGEVVGRIAAMLSFVVLARCFIPEIIGQLAFAASLSAMAGPFVDFGLTSIAGARISRDPYRSGTILGQVWLLRAILACIAIGAIAVVATLYHGGGSIALCVAYAFGLLPAAFASSWVAYLLGVPRIFLAEKLIQAFVYLGLIGVAVLTGPRPIDVAIAAFIAAAVAVGGTWPWVKRVCRLKIQMTLKDATILLRDSFPLFTAMIPAATLIPLVSVLVGWTNGNEAMGLFWLAARLLVIGPIVGNFAASLVVPILASQADDRTFQLHILRTTVWSIVAVGIVTTWMTGSSSEGIVNVLFGPMHLSASPLVACTGAIMAAESTSIVLTRLTPYFDASRSIHRAVILAGALGLMIVTLTWSWLGTTSFMVGIGLFHLGVLVLTVWNWSNEERQAVMRPFGRIVVYPVLIMCCELAVHQLTASPMTAAVIRTALACAMVAMIITTWKRSVAETERS